VRTSGTRHKSWNLTFLFTTRWQSRCNLQLQRNESEIKPGSEYAVREKRTQGTPLHRVRIIEHIRSNKWKAKWIAPNPGLIDYIESGQLIVPWNEHKALLKEEADEERLCEYNDAHGYNDKNSPVIRALEQVFESAADGVGLYRGCLIGAPQSIGRLRTRARVSSAKESSVAYINRRGQLHLPFDEALDLGRKFCAEEPSTVLMAVEATEHDWAHKATHGEGYIVGLLNEYRASWALIRQWAGYDAAVAQREEEIKRLERLLWDTVYALQKAALDSEAAKLRHAIHRK